jgi:hypothetical protein
VEECPDAIHFQSNIVVKATGEPSRLIQFSFSILTSVSYGDAYLVHRVARSLATAEALIGQLYPSILIATLVGMALQGRPLEGWTPDPDETANFPSGTPGEVLGLPHRNKFRRQPSR